MDRHFFLQHHNKSIYCVEYLPQNGKSIDTAVIICTPIWGERIRTHRIFTSLSRELQKKNSYVLTCDYFGDGNSQGESHQLSFENIIEDLNSLYNYALEKYKIENYYFIGFRLGASALISLLDKAEVKKAILIDPILNPISYLEDALRANLTAQMTRHKKIIKNRDVLIKEIKENQLINVDGFLIGAEMWRSFEKYSPIFGNKNFKGDLVILSSENSKKRAEEIVKFGQEFKRARVEFVKKEVVLTSWKYYTQKPPIIFSKIFSEIFNGQLTETGI